jgi:hypothetical protein
MTQHCQCGTLESRDLAHVEGKCWGGLVILLNFLPVHWSRTRQVQLLKGAVEYQCDLDIVLTIGEEGFGQPSIRGSKLETWTHK